MPKVQQHEHFDDSEPQPPNSTPPFSTYTTWVTHLGVVISLIQECGHAVGSYLLWAAGNLYLLGWAHPERWLQWDADRGALHLPGFIPGWLYLVVAICVTLGSWKTINIYLYLVRTANERAWAWFGDFMHMVVLDALEDFLHNKQGLRWLREFIRKVVRDTLREHGHDDPDNDDDPLPLTPTIC